MNGAVTPLGVFRLPQSLHSAMVSMLADDDQKAKKAAGSGHQDLGDLAREIKAELAEAKKRKAEKRKAKGGDADEP